MDIDTLDINTNQPTTPSEKPAVGVPAPEAEWPGGGILNRPQPTLFRVYDDGNAERKLIGSTCFFRNRALLLTILEQLNPEAETVSVLVHAASIGCDAYSFVIAYDLFFQGRRSPRLQCFATDLSESFLDRARRAIYGREILGEMGAKERRYFEDWDEEHCRVRTDIRERVTFLPAASYVDFSSARSFDVVFLVNTLLYVTPADQTRALNQVARYNRRLLVTNRFHADQVRDDMRRNGYEPVPNRLEMIYNGFIPCQPPSPGTMIDGVTHCSPAMEPLRGCEDYSYRFGCLFAKPDSPEVASPLSQPAEL